MDVMGNKETDFVADKNGKKLYINFCLTLNDSLETKKREFGDLLEIKDNYSKKSYRFLSHKL